MRVVLRALAVAVAALWCCAAAVAVGAQPSAARSVADGVYTEAQAQRGKTVYANNCEFCHLSNLSGEATYTPARPLAGRRFFSRWKGKTLAELFLVARDLMPQTAPGSLPPQAYADALAYVLKYNKFPAGSTELPPNEEALARITIPGTQPQSAPATP